MDTTVDINSEEGKKLIEEQKAAAKKRGEFICAQCEFEYMTPSKGAQEACKNVEEIFQACALELGYILPDTFRTVSALESLEAACMWAKKSICVHDKQMTKKEQNGKSNDDSNKGPINGTSKL